MFCKNFKVNRYTFMGKNSIFIFAFFHTVAKGRNFLLNSFPKCWPLWNDFILFGSKQEVKKVVNPCKMVEKPSGEPIHLKAREENNDKDPPA